MRPECGQRVDFPFVSPILFGNHICPGLVAYFKGKPLPKRTHEHHRVFGLTMRRPHEQASFNVSFLRLSCENKKQRARER